MSTYQVFVERPSSPAPDALARLAAAIAKHYGIAAGDLEPRLRAGRFRVKANVDRATAENFALDLEQLGAVVSVVDASGVVVSRAKPAPAPAPAPKAAPRPATDSKAPVFASGLAAAFGAKSDEPDLGALGDASGSFSLSSVDGSDEHAAASSGSFAPPSSSGHDLPASIGPAIAAPAPAPAPAPKAATTPPPMGSGPIDMFAPPDSDEQLVDLAVDMADVKAKRAAAHSTPPPVARSSARATAQPPTAEMPSASAPRPSAVKEQLRAFAGHRRARFAAGAVLAVLVGFLPAHILASVRERSAYAEIDTHLAEKEAQVRSLEQWKTLDKIIEAHRDEKVAEQHSIALTAVILWALVSAGFAFVWFRKIDWDRLAA